MYRIQGQKFDRLTVLEKLPNTPSGKTRWRCECDCGDTAEVQTAHLVSGHTRSCGCFKIERVKETKKLKPFESLYNRFIRRTKEIDRDCTISYEDFVRFTTNTECHYCGHFIDWTSHNIVKNNSRYHLDRIDNNVGYIKGNCVVCCKTCNSMKSGLSYGDFLNHIQLISERFNGNRT